MIKTNDYWINILPSKNEVLAENADDIDGKWLCFGDTQEMQSYTDILDLLVENGKFIAAKIAKKDPERDPFPYKKCVICVFTVSIPENKYKVKEKLIQIGLNPVAWKSNNETMEDWELGGKLYLEKIIGDKCKKKLKNLSYEQNESVIDPRGTKQKAAILITDMVGFSREMSEDELKTFLKMQYHNEVISSIIQEFSGDVIKTIGDAFLAVFNTAEDSVLSAYKIQKQLKKYNKNKSENSKIKIRVGIHYGKVIWKDNDVYGNCVNIAARIEPICEPGCICISDIVYKIVKNSFNMKIERIPDVKMKNIANPPVIYKILT